MGDDAARPRATTMTTYFNSNSSVLDYSTYDDDYFESIVLNDSNSSVLFFINASVNSSRVKPSMSALTSAVVDAHFTLSRFTDEGTLKWHYVGTADDGQNAEVFDAVFAKNNDATAAPPTTPGSDGAAGRSAGLLVALAAAAAAL